MGGVELDLAPQPGNVQVASAIERNNNPVISFESRRLMIRKGPVPEEDYTIPLGQADIKREGSDVTVVALAWLVHEAQAAAEELAKEGISVEVVDPRTLVPLDRDAIRRSAQKTGRHRRRGGTDGRLLGRGRCGLSALAARPRSTSVVIPNPLHPLSLSRRRPPR
jgi:pyruvate/2-oxoacid:ferredoxin oxidoreductase alpha subunit